MSFRVIFVIVAGCFILNNDSYAMQGLHFNIHEANIEVPYISADDLHFQIRMVRNDFGAFVHAFQRIHSDFLNALRNSELIAASDIQIMQLAKSINDLNELLLACDHEYLYVRDPLLPGDRLDQRYHLLNLRLCKQILQSLSMLRQLENNLAIFCKSAWQGQ